MKEDKDKKKRGDNVSNMSEDKENKLKGDKENKVREEEENSNRKLHNKRKLSNL